MDLAVDTNIVFSSLTRSRRIQSILVGLHRNGHIVHAPEELIEELRENIGKLRKYSPLDPDLLNTVVEQALPRLLTLHSTAEIPGEIKEKAKRLVARVDPDDWPFIALAMYLGVPLWTGDKGLLKMSAETGVQAIHRSGHGGGGAIATRGIPGQCIGEDKEEVPQVAGCYKDPSVIV